MAYSRVTTVNGRNVYFTYPINSLFDRVQMLSQYHTSANKDPKTADINLDLAFSDDHKEYFDTYCEKALAHIGNVFLKVNIKSLAPYEFTQTWFKKIARISITDYGFVKDSLLSVLDKQIEECIVNFVLAKWYEHLGFEPLVKKYSDLVNATMVILNESLFQFLRKAYIPVAGISMYWTDSLCVHQANFTITISWSDQVCVGVIDNPLSLASEAAP